MATARDDIQPFERRVDHSYWQGLTVGELRIQRCTSCSGWQWPADWRCPGCGSYELGWEAVEPAGIVYSWVRTRQAFVPAFADLVPYVNVLVELPQAGGARLLGRLLGDDEAISIGARVTGCILEASPLTLDLPVLEWELEAVS